MLNNFVKVRRRLESLLLGGWKAEVWLEPGKEPTQVRCSACALSPLSITQSAATDSSAEVVSLGSEVFIFALHAAFAPADDVEYVVITRPQLICCAPDERSHIWSFCMQGSSLLAKQGKAGEVALVLGAGNQVLLLWTRHGTPPRPARDDHHQASCRHDVVSHVLDVQPDPPRVPRSVASRQQRNSWSCHEQVSVAALDILHKLVFDCAVVICKMNPVNAWVGPYIRCGP